MDETVCSLSKVVLRFSGMKGALCMFLDCIGLFALPLLSYIYPADPKMLVMLHVFFLLDFLGAFSLSWFILWCIFSIGSSVVLL